MNIKEQEGQQENLDQFQETLAEIKMDIRLTRTTLITFAILALILKFVFKVSIPLYIPEIVFLWTLLYFLYGFLIAKKKSLKELNDFYFRNNVIDLLVLTAIIHFLGGAEWIGAIFYLLTLVLVGIILDKKRTFILGSIAILLYSGLVLLEYFQILPHQELFVLRPGLYRDPHFVITQILIIAAFFFFVCESAGTFIEKINQKQKALEEERKKAIKAYKEAEEAKNILEVKVEARTKELANLATEREEIIQERTKELQGKIKELEELQKLFVGRELKMVELKQSLQKTQEELEKLKKKNNKI